MLSFSLVAEALTGLIYHRPSGENSKFLPSASDLPQWLATFSTSDTFSTKQIIFANHAKTLFQASHSKTQIKTSQTVQTFLTLLIVIAQRYQFFMLSLPKC